LSDSRNGNYLLKYLIGWLKSLLFMIVF